MTPNAILVVTSLLSILLLTLHVTDNIVRVKPEIQKREGRKLVRTKQGYYRWAVSFRA